MPAMELIAVVAAAHPGEGGRYNLRQPDSVIRRYLKAARKAKALLILDIQPGRSRLLHRDQAAAQVAQGARRRARAGPRVADGPEPGPGQGDRPRRPPREVNATTDWLNKLTKRYKLPQKLLLIHQFTDDMVPEKELKERDELAYVLNVDGFGTQALKIAKYKNFVGQAPGLPARLQALLLRGHEHDDARPRSCGCSRGRTSWCTNDRWSRRARRR